MRWLIRPFMPAIIPLGLNPCLVLSSAALQLDIPVAIKLVLLQVFDETVLSALAPVFQALIDSFTQRRSSVKAASPQRKHLTKPLTRWRLKTRAPHSFDAELASVLDELAQGDTPINQPGLSELSDSALADELHHLQKRTKPIDAILQPEDLLVVLLQLRAKPIQLSRCQRETLHLASVLFEFISDENILRRRLFSHWCSCKFPYLKRRFWIKHFYLQRPSAAPFSK